MRATPPRSLLDLQGHLETASRSSLCVNGSHIYNEEPQALPRHRSSISGPFPPSGSLHSVSSRPTEEGARPADDSGGRGSRRTSISEVLLGQEELSSRAKVLVPGTSRSGEEEGARLPEGKPVQVATPMVASSEAVAEKEGARKEERKPRMGLFHHHHQGLSRSELGRRGSLGEKGGPTLGASPHHPSSGEEKAKSSWFGLREAKEPTQKPRYVLGKSSFALRGACWGVCSLDPGAGSLEPMGPLGRLLWLWLRMVEWWGVPLPQAEARCWHMDTGKSQGHSALGAIWNEESHLLMGLPSPVGTPAPE